LLFRVKSRCELLIAAGNLDEARRLAEELRPGDDTQSLAARFIGAALCGKISTWRGEVATAIGQFELAAWCYDQHDWSDPGVRERIDTWLAEAYVSAGRLEDAHRIAARLAEIGTRLNRPALLGDAARIGALAAATAGDLGPATVSARAAVEAHERSPLRVELARSLLVLGRIELRRRERRAGPGRPAARPRPGRPDGTPPASGRKHPWNPNHGSFGQILFITERTVVSRPGPLTPRGAARNRTGRSVYVVFTDTTAAGVTEYPGEPAHAAPLWPWKPTPLVAQATGAWLISLGVAAAHTLLERDAARAPRRRRVRLARRTAVHRARTLPAPVRVALRLRHHLPDLPGPDAGDRRGLAGPRAITH
jgi:hypothetical protein